MCEEMEGEGVLNVNNSIILFIFYREKEDDLENKYQLLIRELRTIIAIEGNY